MSFSQPSLGGLLGPKVGFRIGLRENAWGTDEIPSCESKASFAVFLLSGDVLDRAIKDSKGERKANEGKKGERRKREDRRKVLGELAPSTEGCGDVAQL